MWKKVRTHLITGVFILIPLAITYFTFSLLLGIVNVNLSIPIGRFLLGLFATDPGREVSAFMASAIGIPLLLILTFLTGLFGSSLFGQQVVTATETLIEHIPVFKSVYTTIKQIVNELSPNQDRSSFRKVVLVTNPDGQVHLGFLTSELVLEGNAPMRSVYIPTNHLWFGEIRIVPVAQVTELDLPVEQGISFILSCGAAAPAALKKR